MAATAAVAVVEIVAKVLGAVEAAPVLDGVYGKVDGEDCPEAETEETEAADVAPEEETVNVSDLAVAVSNEVKTL